MWDLKVEITENEVSEEYKEIIDYSNHRNESSSYEESFINYVKDKVIDENKDKTIRESGFKTFSELQKVLEECTNKGYSPECLQQLKLVEIFKNVQNNNSSDTLESKVRDGVEEQLNIIEKLGEVKLKEIFNAVYQHKDKISINPNYVDIGVSLISYKLLLNAYNKYVDSKPLANIPAEHLKTIKTTRAFSRYFFACLVAPALVLSFRSTIVKGPLFSINANLDEKNNDNNSTNMSYGLLFLFKKVNK